MLRLAAKLHFVLVAFFLAGTLNPSFAAQLSSLAPGQAASQSAQNPNDPLGRDAPYGSIVGFLHAAQEEKNELAAQYFQPAKGRRRSSEEQDEELVQPLLAILNQKFSPFLDSLSRDPQGRLDDGLPPDVEAVHGYHGDPQQFQLLLVRQEDARGHALWYISRQTLDQVPKVYDSLRYPRIEKLLPKFLVDNRPLAMPLWQWVAIILALPLCLGLGWLFAKLGYQVLRGYRRSRGLPPLPEQHASSFGPGTLLLSAIFHYTAVILIGASLLYRQYYRRLIWILLILSVYWAVTRTTAVAARLAEDRLLAHGRYAERSLVALTRRIINVIVLTFLGLIALRTLGVNVTAALAGLGIGGLAVGLGAQKTFENLLGGISILSDRALQIGDVCKVGDQIGVVEDIGLRSTKLRTMDRTLVSIPNGTVATATLENYRWRDKILSKQIVRLRYDISPEHLRYVIEKIREVLEQDPKIEPTSARARLVRLADYAFEVEVFAYFLERDYTAFLAAQENLLMRITQVVEQSGTSIASSQNIIFSGDEWKDPEKAKAAARALEKLHDPGVPGPRRPELTPDVTPPRKS